ncbi:MAG: TIGR00730 family Rossman fold protein [Candidatus Dependentiae bacterium]|nr:TIGR00730 family Rossman fold protein [Candidatus Dependentiae bacterium]
MKMQFFERLSSVFWLVIGNFWVLPQLVRSGWRIAKLPAPIVTVFGGKAVSDPDYLSKAIGLTRRLAQADISIITGGGPGIMEAANHGAREAGSKAHSVGVGVSGINTVEPVNPYVTDYIVTDFFYLRKHLLIYYSHAFVAFPGGFGTLDEVSEVVMLMQTKKLPVMPVVLVGEAYWSGLIHWLAEAVKERIVSSEHAELITVTDDIDAAADMIIRYCRSTACVRWRHKGMI